MYSLTYQFYIQLKKLFSQHSLLIRGFIRVANKVLPFYFLVNPIKPRIPTDENPQTIVSLTTFPARVDKVWLTIESIFYQSHKPDKILLWLYHGEFEGKNSLPKKLQDLENRGLEIRFCNENLMPHKKYFYTMQEFPNANIITIDDDILYPPNLVLGLNTKHIQYPEAILCTIARRILVDGCDIVPYNQWTVVKRNTQPRFDLLPIGAGSVYYPSRSLDPRVHEKNEIEGTALKADDLWLKTMALLQGTRVVSLAGKFNYPFIPVFHKNRIRLMEENIKGGGNDMVFAKLLDKYNIGNEIFSN